MPASLNISFYNPYPEEKPASQPLNVGFDEIFIEAEIFVVRDFGSRKVKAFGVGKNGRALSLLFQPVDSAYDAELIVFGEALIEAEKHLQEAFPKIPQVVFFDSRRDQPRYRSGVVYPWEREHDFE